MKQTAGKAGKKKAVAKGSASDRVVWRRDAKDQNITGQLGERIRKHREKLGLSINAASDLTDIPGASLSRIENNKMSPTFPVLLKLMTGLRLPWAELMSESGAASTKNKVSVDSPIAAKHADLPGYAYSILHTDSPHRKQVQPMVMDVLATTIEEAGGLRGHEGVEFCYVLSGTLQLHIEDESMRELPKGASALFNCDVPHAYVAKKRTKTTVLIIVVSDPLTHNNSEEPIRRRSLELVSSDD